MVRVDVGDEQYIQKRLRRDAFDIPLYLALALG